MTQEIKIYFLGIWSVRCRSLRTTRSTRRKSRGSWWRPSSRCRCGATRHTAAPWPTRAWACGAAGSRWWSAASSSAFPSTPPTSTSRCSRGRGRASRWPSSSNRSRRWRRRRCGPRTCCRRARTARRGCRRSSARGSRSCRSRCSACRTGTTCCRRWARRRGRSVPPSRAASWSKASSTWEPSV